MFRKNNVYKTFLLSFLAIAMVTLILMIPFTYSFDKKITNQNAQINEYLMRENVKTIQDSIDNAINIIHAFHNSKYMDDFTEDYFNSKQVYYGVAEVSEYIKTLLEQNLYVDNLAVYVKRYDSFVSAYGLLTPENYYDIFYPEYNNFDVWYDEILKENKLNFHKGNTNTYKKMYYKFDMEKKSSQVGEISIIAEISESVLKKVVDDVSLSTLSGVAICSTESNSWVFSSDVENTSEIENGEKQKGIVVFKQADKRYNIEYMLLCDSLGIRQYSILTWGAFLIICIIVVLSVFYYMHRMSKSKFRTLFDLFSTDGFVFYKENSNMQLDDFKLMKFYIDMLSKSRDNSAAWSKFFRFINGLADDETKEAFLNKLNRNKYLLIVVEPYKEDLRMLKNNRYTIDNIKTIFINIIDELLSAYYIVISEQIDNNFCYLLNSDDFDKSNIIDVVENVKTQLEKHFGIHIFVGIGGVKNVFSDISLSYYEALDALSHSKQNDCEDMVFFDEVKDKKAVSDIYDESKGDVLAGYIECGDKEHAFSIIESIIDSVALDKPFSQQAKIYIAKNLQEILDRIKISDFIGENDVKSIVLGSNSINQLKNTLYTLIEKNVYNYIEQKKNNRMLQIREYIDANYSDINLSVTGIADVFGLNSIYMARIFKEYFNDTISSYIKSVRFEHAKELLIETEERIENIAEKVGYNKQTFSRTFKNYIGCTPKEFRLRYRR